MIDTEDRLASTDPAGQRRRRLRWVRWVALADLVLLLALLAASLTGRREWVSLLGPLHGGNFLVLLTLVWLGVVDGLWGWWFLFAVLLTAGPIGAFVGEWVIGRQVQKGDV